MAPADPDRLRRDLAAAINALMADPRASADGSAGRRRDRAFSWASIADRTVDLYRDLLGSASIPRP